MNSHTKLFNYKNVWLKLYNLYQIKTIQKLWKEPNLTSPNGSEKLNPLKWPNSPIKGRKKKKGKIITINLSKHNLKNKKFVNFFRKIKMSDKMLRPII